MSARTAHRERVDDRIRAIGFYCAADALRQIRSGAQVLEAVEVSGEIRRETLAGIAIRADFVAALMTDLLGPERPGPTTDPPPPAP